MASSRSSGKSAGPTSRSPPSGRRVARRDGSPRRPATTTPPRALPRADRPAPPPRRRWQRTGAILMGSVRVAIVGVGNCASSLVQGVEYYKDADPESRVPGLMHVQFGPYHVRDVEFVAAFDVDAKKVGRDLAEAIGASENNTIKICDVPPTGITVQRGPTLDGLGQYYQEMITESDDPYVDLLQVLRDAHAQLLVSSLPARSEHADRHYLPSALHAPAASLTRPPL